MDYTVHGVAAPGRLGVSEEAEGPWALGVEAAPRLSRTRPPVSSPPRPSPSGTHTAPPERVFSCVVP